MNAVETYTFSGHVIILALSFVFSFGLHCFSACLFSRNIKTDLGKQNTSSNHVQMPPNGTHLHISRLIPHTHNLRLATHMHTSIRFFSECNALFVIHAFENESIQRILFRSKQTGRFSSPAHTSILLPKQPQLFCCQSRHMKN